MPKMYEICLKNYYLILNMRHLSSNQKSNFLFRMMYVHCVVTIKCTVTWFWQSLKVCNYKM